MRARNAFGLAAVFCVVMAIVSCTGCAGSKGQIRTDRVGATEYATFPQKSGVSNWFEENVLQKPVKKGNVVVFKFMGQTDPNWALRMEAAFKDDNVAAVIMWIESGGGYVYEAKLLGHRLRVLKETYGKPLYIYSEIALYSGAYWVAVEADSIFVGLSGGVGSIGVRMQRIDATGKDSADGIKVYTFTSGSRKALGNPHTKMTAEEMKLHKAHINALWQQFMWQVWSNRMDTFMSQLMINTKSTDLLVARTMLATMGDGRTFGPKVAAHYGFIDAPMYFDELVKLMVARGYKVVDARGREVGLFLR